MADLTPPSTRIKIDSKFERYKPEARKALYKNESKHLEWKEAYRQRCSERLKSKRDREFNRRRTALVSPTPSDSTNSSNLISTVYDVMQEEWDQMRSETHLPPVCIRGQQKRSLSSPSLSDCKKSHIASSNEDSEYLMYTPERNLSTVHTEGVWSSPYNEEDDYDIDEILSMMDNITQELIKEEQEMLIARYEESLQFTDRAIEAAVDSNDDGQVICPLCLRDVLQQEQEVIYCSCGLSINTAQDMISLEYLRLRLNEGVTKHNQFCSSPPVFSCQEFLTMSCQHCDFLHVIV